MVINFKEYNAYIIKIKARQRQNIKMNKNGKGR